MASKRISWRPPRFRLQPESYGDG